MGGGIAAGGGLLLIMMALTAAVTGLLAYTVGYGHGTRDQDARWRITVGERLASLDAKVEALESLRPMTSLDEAELAGFRTRLRVEKQRLFGIDIREP